MVKEAPILDVACSMRPEWSVCWARLLTWPKRSGSQESARALGIVLVMNKSVTEIRVRYTNQLLLCMAFCSRVQVQDDQRKALYSVFPATGHLADRPKWGAHVDISTGESKKGDELEHICWSSDGMVWYQSIGNTSTLQNVFHFTYTILPVLFLVTLCVPWKL